jgi:hypothetical protein
MGYIKGVLERHAEKLRAQREAEEAAKAKREAEERARQEGEKARLQGWANRLAEIVTRDFGVAAEHVKTGFILMERRRYPFELNLGDNLRPSYLSTREDFNRQLDGRSNRLTPVVQVDGLITFAFHDSHRDAWQPSLASLSEAVPTAVQYSADCEYWEVTQISALGKAGFEKWVVASFAPKEGE